MKRTLCLAALICAASSMPSARAATKCVVPKSWGRIVIVVNQGERFDGVVFEAEDGTLRKMNLGNCDKGLKPDWEISRE